MGMLIKKLESHKNQKSHETIVFLVDSTQIMQSFDEK